MHITLLLAHCCAACAFKASSKSIKSVNKESNPRMTSINRRVGIHPKNYQFVYILRKRFYHRWTRGWLPKYELVAVPSLLFFGPEIRNEYPIFAPYDDMGLGLYPLYSSMCSINIPNPSKEFSRSKLKQILPSSVIFGCHTFVKHFTIGGTLLRNIYRLDTSYLYSGGTLIENLNDPPL